MAGDWIKMRTRLHEDPAVERLVELTGLDSFGVIGRLHRLWSWASEQLRNGYAPGVTLVRVDARVAHEGFARAMCEVGWLTAERAGVRFPRWSSHNSKSAKERALARDRMQRMRYARGVTGASLEKRREEKKINNPPSPPSGKGGTASARGRKSKQQRLAEQAERVAYQIGFAELARRGTGPPP
jgi:hypothetical protein